MITIDIQKAFDRVNTLCKKVDIMEIDSFGLNHIYHTEAKLYL